MKMLRLTKKRIAQIPCLVIASDDLRKAFLHDALEAVVKVQHRLDERGVVQSLLLRRVLELLQPAANRQRGQVSVQKSPIRNS